MGHQGARTGRMVTREVGFRSQWCATHRILGQAMLVYTEGPQIGSESTLQNPEGVYIERPSTNTNSNDGFGGFGSLGRLGYYVLRIFYLLYQLNHV